MSQIEDRDQAARTRRRVPFAVVGLTALALLFGVPWASLVLGGQDWPGWGVALGTALLAAGAVVLPWAMVAGHGRGRDGASILGDTLLGLIWIVFAWTLVGELGELALALAGVDDPVRSRVVAVAVLVVAAVLAVVGWHEAMRVPRVRATEVRLPRLGPGLDGTRVVLLADTHYGPIDRARWSARTAAAVNALDPDIVCHAGDIADGTPEQRRAQAAPLGDIAARFARVYVTGNHEYYSHGQQWLDHMAGLGWQALHNRHVVVERGGDRLVVAGMDDLTAHASGLPGHGADLGGALAGADPALPVLLLAYQPKQVAQAVAAGVDLQVSGHTHGGQIWAFHYLVWLDQRWLQGLSRPGGDTQLYTSRGAGFWGPPFRVFAPSEISLLTLRAA